MSVAFGQVSTELKPAKKTLSKNKTVCPVKKTIQPVKKFSFLGDFKVTKYYVLKLKTPSQKELEQIVGSTVKITTSSLAGSELDLVSFSLTSSELMMRSDYVTEMFGRELRVKEPDLPVSFLVHRTNNELCGGIAEIDSKHIAIPYKGVLLFLERI